MSQNKHLLFVLENLSFSLLQSPDHSHDPDCIIALWRGHQTANRRSWGLLNGEDSGRCRSPSRARQECNHVLKLTRAHDTEAIAASCFYAGFRENHSYAKLRVIWAGGIQLQSNNYRYKVLEYCEEHKTCRVNLCQTCGVILLLILLHSYGNPKATFTELAERSLHHYYRRGFKYVNRTGTFKILLLATVLFW